MLYIFKDKILILASFFVFLFLNVLENLIQFTIGRKPDSKKILEITAPSKKDWIKIAVVTLIFALLQGVLTSFFNAVFHQKS